MLAGFIGMRAATRANEATALAAKDKGEMAAFLTALRGGSVMGFMVASLGLLGLGILFCLYVVDPVNNFVQIIGIAIIEIISRFFSDFFVKRDKYFTVNIC